MITFIKKLLAASPGFEYPCEQCQHFRPNTYMSWEADRIIYASCARTNLHCITERFGGLLHYFANKSCTKSGLHFTFRPDQAALRFLPYNHSRYLHK